MGEKTEKREQMLLDLVMKAVEASSDWEVPGWGGLGYRVVLHKSSGRMIEICVKDACMSKPVF